jgi:electron transfer flavoprotein alpha subunit
MRILIYVEAHQGIVTGSSRELIAAARQIDANSKLEIEAFVAASEPETLANQLQGATTTVAIRHSQLTEYNPEAQVLCLVEAVRERKPDLVLLAYTSAGLDLASNLSARCDLPLVSYCTRLKCIGNELAVEAQAYGGKVVAEITVPLPAILMVTPGAYREEDAGVGEGAFVDLNPPTGLAALRTHVVTLNAPDPNSVDITRVERLVSVGRGIGDKANIDEARQLAEMMGGEIAGSRPVVDAGWLPKERQVGKSGRKVKPRVYLALGISGAPEHLEGMAAAELIIAVNSDAKAPIFDHAHFGATVDALDFIEELKKQLAERGT